MSLRSGGQPSSSLEVPATGYVPVSHSGKGAARSWAGCLALARPGRARPAAGGPTWPTSRPPRAGPWPPPWLVYGGGVRRAAGGSGEAPRNRLGSLPAAEPWAAVAWVLTTGLTRWPWGTTLAHLHGTGSRHEPALYVALGVPRKLRQGLGLARFPGEQPARGALGLGFRWPANFAHPGQCPLWAVGRILLGSQTQQCSPFWGAPPRSPSWSLPPGLAWSCPGPRGLVTCRCLALMGLSPPGSPRPGRQRAGRGSHSGFRGLVWIPPVHQCPGARCFAKRQRGLGLPPAFLAGGRQPVALPPGSPGDQPEPGVWPVQVA